MSAAKSHLLICSCEKTMPLDAQAIGRGCAAEITQANQLCGLELERFKEALADGAPVTVACTQEAPLFREVAENFPQAQLTFVNIRETGGWSNDAAAAGPKAAALIAAAGEDMPPISLVTLESTGVALIYGRDEIAIEAAQRLADRLDITVLLTKPGDVTPRRTNEFPVLKGTIRNARGHLGAFELAIDDYALPLPSSRAKLVFGPSRDGATSTCDLILDLSGGTPMFPAHELRPGYLRADPRDRAAVERAIADAGNLVGTFDKPRFIHFEASLCAHSRSGITGCTRCLDLCPTGAITPNGNAVAIDANVCAGCGSCASVCPTGAASYSLPSADALMRRLRTLLQTYRKAGGSDAIVLFHDVASMGAPGVRPGAGRGHRHRLRHARADRLRGPLRLRHGRAVGHRRVAPELRCRGKNQILLNPRAHAAVDELIDVEEVGQLSLKGFARPIPTVNVLAIREPADNGTCLRDRSRRLEVPRWSRCGSRPPRRCRCPRPPTRRRHRHHLRQHGQARLTAGGGVLLSGVHGGSTGTGRVLADGCR